MSYKAKGPQLLCCYIQLRRYLLRQKSVYFVQKITNDKSMFNPGGNGLVFYVTAPGPLSFRPVHGPIYKATVC